jgi:hypothetical protein
MTETTEVERTEVRDGITYRLNQYASLWVAFAGNQPLCAPSSYEFAYERFTTGRILTPEHEK